MDIAKGDLVIATAGREEGKLFFVLEVQAEYLLLADGKARKIESPTRKKNKHVQLVASSSSRTAEKIRSGIKITNSELRKALAIYSENGNQDQEG